MQVRPTTGCVPRHVGRPLYHQRFRGASASARPSVVIKAASVDSSQSGENGTGATVSSMATHLDSLPAAGGPMVVVSHLTPGIPITAVAGHVAVPTPGMPAAAEIAEPLVDMEHLEEGGSSGFLANITKAIGMPGGLRPQPRLNQLRAEVAALQGREQQLAQQMTEMTEEAHLLRAQLAAREEAAAQLAQAKRAAEAAAEQMRQQLEAAQAQVAVAVEQAAFAQEAAAMAQEETDQTEAYRLGLQEALLDLQNERMHREQLKLEILNAEHSSAAAKKLAAEVQALQRKLAGVVKKQVATAASLQSKLDQATSECTQLRGQLAAAEQKAANFETQLVMAAGERGRLQERCTQLEAEVESVRSAAAAEQLKMSSVWSARVDEALQQAAAAKAQASAEVQRNAALEQESHILQLALDRAKEEVELARLSMSDDHAASDELLRRMEHDLQVAAQQVHEATLREQQVLAELKEATEAVNVLYSKAMGPDAQLRTLPAGQSAFSQQAAVPQAPPALAGEAAALAMQLEQARQEAAEAQAAAQAAKSRSMLLDKAWAAALDDSKALHAERRELKAALAQSQREALALAAKLEAARQQASNAQSLADQLEEARMEVAAAKALATKLAEDAVSAHEEGRGSLLQQAWPGMPMWKGT